MSHCTCYPYGYQKTCEKHGEKLMTASEMGKLGAQARIKATTTEQRKTWARKAGKASGKARRKIKSEINEQRDDKLVSPISTT